MANYLTHAAAKAASAVINTDTIQGRLIIGTMADGDYILDAVPDNTSPSPVYVPISNPQGDAVPAGKSLAVYQGRLFVDDGANNWNELALGATSPVLVAITDPQGQAIPTGKQLAVFNGKIYTIVAGVWDELSVASPVHISTSELQGATVPTGKSVGVFGEKLYLVTPGGTWNERIANVTETKLHTVTAAALAATATSTPFRANTPNAGDVELAIAAANTATAKTVTAGDIVSVQAAIGEVNYQTYLDGTTIRVKPFVPDATSIQTYPAATAPAEGTLAPGTVFQVIKADNSVDLVKVSDTGPGSHTTIGSYGTGSAPGGGGDVTTAQLNAAIAAISDASYRNVSIAVLPASATIPPEVNALTGDDAQENDRVRGVAPGFVIYYRRNATAWAEESREEIPSVDQVYSPTSTNAPSAVAIEARLLQLVDNLDPQRNIGPVDGYVAADSPITALTGEKGDWVHFNEDVADYGGVPQTAGTSLVLTVDSADGNGDITDWVKSDALAGTDLKDYVKRGFGTEAERVAANATKVVYLEFEITSGANKGVIYDFVGSTDALRAWMPRNGVISSERERESVSSDKTFTANDFYFGKSRISADLRNGSLNLNYPEGMPIGSIIDIEIPAYADGNTITGMIGGGGNELFISTISNAQNEFVVKGQAGSFYFVKTSDTHWEQRSAVDYMAKPAGPSALSYPTGFIVEVPYDGTGAITSKIALSDTSSYSIQYPDATTNNVNHNANEVYTPASAGIVRYVFTGDTRPTSVSVKGQLSGKIEDFIGSMSRYNTVTNWTFSDDSLKFTGDLGIAAMRATASRVWTINSDGVSFVAPLETIVEYAPETYYLVLTGDLIKSTGSLDKITAVATDFQRIIVDGPLNELTGNLSIAATLAPLNNIRINGDKNKIIVDMKQMGDNSPDITNLFLAGRGVKAYGNTADLVAGCPLLTSITLDGNLVDVNTDVGAVYASTTALRSIVIRGRMSKAKALTVPTLPSSMSNISLENMENESDVDNLFQGASNVTTWTGSKKVSALGTSPAPSTATTTPVTGWAAIAQGNGATTIEYK